MNRSRSTGVLARRLFTVAMASLLLAASAVQAQQAFPSQPIRLIVPAAPGGSTDILARSLARIMQEQSGVAVIVDNKAGAGGAIGVQAAVQAAPNGYTLLVTVPDGVTVLPNLRKDIPYNAERDLVPIGLIAETSWLFAVNAKLPYKNMKELVQAAAAKPGSIRFASPGTGTSAHLITELLGIRNNLQMLHVPYKGAGPATTAVIAGEVDLIATSPISLKNFLDSGQLRGLAITGGTRAAALPAIPTMVEAGFPDFVASAWFGVFAPAGMPAGRAEKLDEMVSAAVHHPDLQKQIAEMGLDSRFMSRTDFARYVTADSARWKQVIEKSRVVVTD